MARVPFGPLDFLVNVGWGGGYFVVITTFAQYRYGTPGTRLVELTLTKEGEDAGGKILAQKQFDVLIGGVITAESTFRAVLQFGRTVDLGQAFRLKLKGTIVHEDPASPPPTITFFCGTTTQLRRETFHAVHAIINGHPQTQAWVRVHAEYTTPAGTIINDGDNQVAFFGGDDEIEAADGTVRTFTSSVQEIWYVDAFGNYTNTHHPCSELVSGPPPLNSRRIEGFKFIQCDVYPRKGYLALPLIDWTINNEIVFANGPLAIGGFEFSGTVPVLRPGLNADFVPIFDDLPDGLYEFNFNVLVFDTLPAAKSPVKKKLSSGEDQTTYLVAGVFPFGPTFAKYSFRTATINPYQVHKPPFAPLPGQVGGSPLSILFNPGIVPPGNTVFD